MSRQDFLQYAHSLAQSPAREAATVVAHQNRSPEQVADARRIATILGVPSSAVVLAPDAYRREAEQERAADALRDAPGLSQWIVNPENAALAQDDIANLAALSREYGAIGRRVASGSFQTAAGVRMTGAQMDAQMLADFGRSREDLIQDELNRLPYESAEGRNRAIQAGILRYDLVANLTEEDIDDIIARGAAGLGRASELMQAAQGLEQSPASIGFTTETLANAENTVAGTLGAFIRDPVRGAAFLTETAAESLPIIAASSAATLVTRSPAGGAVTMGAGSFLRENAVTAADFLDERGIDYSTPEAAAALLQDADLMAQAQQRGVARGLIIALFDAVSGGVAGQAIVNSPAGDLVAQGLAQAALGAGGEATAQFALDGELDAREIVIEGLAELVTAPIEVLGVGGRMLGDRAAANRLEAERRQRLDAIDAVAGQSALRARDPEAFLDAMNAAGGDQAQMFVPADGVRELFQSNDIDLEQGLAAWGVSAQDFEAAELSGGDVAISAANYTARISGTEQAQWVRENAVFDPAAMAGAEIDAVNAETEATLRAAFEDMQREVEQEAETRAGDQRVFEQVLGELRQAGRSLEVATQEATVMAAFWRTMAERMDFSQGDAFDFFRQRGLTVRGPLTPETVRRRGEMDMMLNTLRSQGDQASLPRGMSIADFVRSEGGVRDRGGDVAALELSGLVAETSEQIREREQQPDLDGSMAQGQGLPLEDMARRVAEAGYWPDLIAEVRQGRVEVGTDLVARLMQALSDEASGNPTYVEGEGPDASLVDLAARLSERAIDLAAVDNDAAIEALEAPEDGARALSQKARGSIMLPQGGMTEGQTVINLFQGADLSTFLHESGHYFLEAFTELASLPDAPQQLQDDLAAIRKHLKNDGEAYTTEQHETWARLTEAYVMEGKAPSLALMDAFTRFRAWLTRIYRTLAGLNVRPTAEIREVMDRMLATDQEIADARAAQQMSPLFAENPQGMSESDWQTYQRMARRSEDQAQQRILDRAMAAVRRRREDWWKQERADVEAEVTERINRQPVYRLTEALANGQWLGNDDAQIEDMRIDRDMLVEQTREGVLQEVNRQALGGRRAIYKNDGTDPRVVAQFFGFDTVQSMVDALQNASKRKDAIAAETDRIMTERHGDPLTDGSIEEEALAAVHTDQQAETITSEIRYLAGQMNASTRGIRSRVYKARAKSLIGSMSVQQAKRPHNFLAAERRAARKAEQAFARVARGGGRSAIAEARQAKEQQLLNHYLYQEAREIEAMVSRGRERMRSYDRASVREIIGTPHIEQIDGLLEGYEFRQRSQRQIGNAEQLVAWVTQMQAEDRGGELNVDARVLEAAHRRHYTRLSVDELRGLFDTVANIDHVGRRTRKVVTRRRKRELGQSAARVSQAIMQSQPLRDSGRSSLGRSAINLLSRPDTIMVRLDNGEEFGAVYDEVKRDIDAAQVDDQQLNVQMMEAVSAIFSEHYTRKDLRAMGTERAIGEQGSWSKEQLLMIALNTGTESNYQRLLDRNVDERQRLTPEKLNALLGTLDQRDWRFVQDIWNEIDSHWADVSEVSRRRTGVAPEKVPARQMWEGAPSFVTGGYFRLFYDADLSDRARRDQESLFDEQLSAGWGATAQVNNGMTKTRAQTASGRAVRLSFSSITQQLRETSRLITMSEAVDASARILRHPDVTAAMKATGNNDTLQTLEIWLQDMASGPIFNTDLPNRAARTVKNNFTLSRLALNLKTVVLQATGLSQSAVTIGHMNMLRGAAAYVRRPQAMTQQILEMSPFMQERRTTFQKDIMDFRNDVATVSPVVTGWRRFQDVAAQIGFEPIIRMQFHVVDVPTWLGAYQAGLAKGRTQEQAVHEADRMVARAQDSGLFGDRSAVERGSVSRNVRQADVVRMFTALAGYMLTKLNRANVVYLQARLGMQNADTNTARAAIAFRLASDMMVLFAFEAVVMGLAYAAMTDEEDDEALAQFIARETALATIAGVPVVRDIAGAVQGFNDGGTYGTVTNTFAASVTQLLQGELDEAAIRSGVNLIGLTTGLPSTASMRAIDYLHEQDETPLSEALFGSSPLTR